MDHVDSLELSYDWLAKLVANLTATELVAATPCPDWNVRAVLNHVVSAARMFTLVNAGEAAVLDTGDLLGEDPAASLAAVARDHVESWRRAGALDGDRSYFFGTFPAPAALLVNLTEVVVHGWDLATATDQDRAIDPQVARALNDFWQPIPLDPHRASGAFGPQIPIDTTAPATDRLLGYLGRQP